MNAADKLLIKYGFTVDGGVNKYRKKRNSNKSKSKGFSLARQQQVTKQSKALIASRHLSTPSHAESKIISFLVQNRVEFVREAYVADLINPNTGKVLFFDFYIPSLRLFIEFDGIYHFRNKDKEELRKQKFKDRLKNEYCRKRQYHLLRIPFFEFNRFEEILCAKFDELSGI